MAVVYLILRDETWFLTVFPDSTDLDTSRDVGTFKSLDTYKNAGMLHIITNGWSSGAYECGSDCEPLIAHPEKQSCENIIFATPDSLVSLP